jgi:hypothetical protein
MEKRTQSGLMARIIVTIITISAFLSGSLIYIGFFAGGYSLFQKIIVFLVALILAVTVVSIAWVTWAGRRGMIHMGDWGSWDK